MKRYNSEQLPLFVFFVLLVGVAFLLMIPSVKNGVINLIGAQTEVITEIKSSSESSSVVSISHEVEKEPQKHKNITMKQIGKVALYIVIGLVLLVICLFIGFMVYLYMRFRSYKKIILQQITKCRSILDRFEKVRNQGMEEKQLSDIEFKITKEVDFLHTSSIQNFNQFLENEKWKEHMENHYKEVDLLSQRLEQLEINIPKMA